MKWTRKSPNKTGYYWYKDSSNDEIIVLSITECDEELWASDGDRIFFTFTPNAINKENKTVYWSDIPIPYPE